MSTDNNHIIKHKVWYKKIPTLFTILNSLCGFFAILYALQAYRYAGNAQQLSNTFKVCFSLIIIAMIFDALDGFLARKLKARSIHGMHMDSLADAISFGLAPAVIISVNSHVKLLANEASFNEFYIWIMASIYVTCSILRLANYNSLASVNNKTSKSIFFKGLPSPAAAFALCIFFVFGFANNRMQHPLSLPIYAAFLGLLMNSRIPYPHIIKLYAKQSLNLKIIIPFITICAILINFKLTLSSLILLYIFSGPLLSITKLFKNKNIEQISHVPK